MAAFDDIFDDGRCIIDVRSPGEFSLGAVPGSHSVPLFSDEERAVVGTRYAREGADPALNEAIRLVSPKIPSLVDAVHALRTDDRPVIVLCWRGGMRSSSVVTFLTLARIPAEQYAGGYKSYRASIRRAAARIRDDFRTITVRGLTGTGKTAIMRKAASLGAAFLDLEAYAGHRGSAFGGVGLVQPTQQNFENALGDALERYRRRGIRTLFIEGESRRIGRMNVPDAVTDAINRSDFIEITATMDERVRTILDDYRAHITPDIVTATLDRIRDALGGERHAAYTMLAREERYAELTALLMENYYDTGYTFFWNKYGGGRCLRTAAYSDALDAVMAIAREHA